MKTDENSIVKRCSYKVDISRKDELKRWSQLLSCNEEELAQAAVQSSYGKVVDIFLYLQRK